MWKRIKKLFNFFPENKEDLDTDIASTQQTNDLHTHISKENNQPNRQTERSFRFPLIPDDPYDPKERRAVIDERPSIQPSIRPKQNTYKPKVKQKDHRQSFKPSRFASPIHGYEDRRRQEKIEHVPTFMRRKQQEVSEKVSDDSVTKEPIKIDSEPITHEIEQQTERLSQARRTGQKNHKKNVDKIYTEIDDKKNQTDKAKQLSKKIINPKPANLMKTTIEDRQPEHPQQNDEKYSNENKQTNSEKLNNNERLTRTSADMKQSMNRSEKTKQLTVENERLTKPKIETKQSLTKDEPEIEQRQTAEQLKSKQTSRTTTRQSHRKEKETFTKKKSKETRQQRRQREREERHKQKRLNKRQQKLGRSKSNDRPIPFNVMMTPFDQKKIKTNKSSKQSVDKQLDQKEKNISKNDQRKNTNVKTNDERSEQSGVISESSDIRTKKKRSENQKRLLKEAEQIPTAQRTDSKQRESIDKQNKDQQVTKDFHFPLHLLDDPVQTSAEDQQWVAEQKEVLEQTLHHFNVEATVVRASQGPTVTRFEVKPAIGVKVSRIRNLSDDLKMNMAAKDIRIEAPIPGKNTVGIEIPNLQSQMVSLQEIFESSSFKRSKDKLTVGLGLDVEGKSVVTTISDMPHGLIAGATGSGKSVCINTILLSLLYRESYKDLKLMLIDPKMVELSPYNGIPHLVSQVITDVKAATAALKWAVQEMEDRYEKFVTESVRDIDRYNKKMIKENRQDEKMPRIVIVIDELADLMMVSPQDVEDAICRIAQKARACGMHLLIATQRPSVDVITGLIKANIPTRIAFSVSSQVDSRTIIDMGGAERLLGRGDMLFFENGSGKGLRLQGAFVSDDEIERITHYLRQIAEPNYLFEQEDLLKQVEMNEEDELFSEVVEFILAQDQASTSMIQRQFRIGYNRAARLMDSLEAKGIISGQQGSRPRNVLMDREQLQEIINI